jgi:hypothetical protein
MLAVVVVVVVLLLLALRHAYKTHPTARRRWCW